MRVIPIIISLFSIGVVLGSEPIPIVVGRWDWAAVKFDQDADKALRRGDVESARRDVAEALRRAPNYWPALYTRARLYAHEGKWDLALRDCNETLKQYSGWIPVALLRARINAHIGNHAAARSEFDHIISIEPRPQFYAMAFNNRAWFRATCTNPSFRDPHGAIDDAKKACTITQWKEADPIDTLATAYAAAGDFESAVRYEQQATQAYDAAEMGKSLQAHLALFQQHKPIAK